MNETKLLNGTMDLDRSQESKAPNDYGKAFNYRSSGTEENEANYGTNIEGTQIVTPNGQRPEGITTGIGAGKVTTLKKSYQMYYNTAGYHQFTELDADTLVEQLLFEDKTDTGGVNIFKLTSDSFFQDIKMLHSDIVVMTDGSSGQIQSINIERFKNGGYVLPITAEDFNLIKAQPLKPARAAYVDDPAKNSNLLKSKLFQFRNIFGYEDYRKSCYGTISNRPTPELEMTDIVGDNPNKNNGIVVTFDIGDMSVKEVGVAVREGKYNWRLVKTLKREYILTLPNQTIDIPSEVREAYNPSTNEYSFVFYNEFLGEVIDVRETNEAYDNVPNNARTLEIINGDILALGDIDEGYDRPAVSVELGVTTYLPELDTQITNPRNFTLTIRNERIDGTHKRYATLDIYGTPKTGDRIIINQYRIGNPDAVGQYDYSVSTAENNNLPLLIENLYNTISSVVLPFPLGGSFFKKRQVHSSTHGTINFVQDNYIESSAYIILNQTGSVEGKTLGIVKGNTSYQAAAAHFDKHGKYLPIVTGNKSSVITPSYATSLGNVPIISWSLVGTPPPEAVSAQILISENSKYLKQLYK